MGTLYIARCDCTGQVNLRRLDAVNTPDETTTDLLTCGTLHPRRQEAQWKAGSDVADDAAAIHRAREWADDYAAVDG